jgi:hypothetical protein
MLELKIVILLLLWIHFFNNITALGFEVTKNNLTCFDEALCVKSDYDKDKRPTSIDSGPLGVHLDIWIIDVSEVNDITQQMTLEMYLDVIWTDPRLIINITEDKAFNNKIFGKAKKREKR